jgi:ATP-dependent DNA ligase
MAEIFEHACKMGLEGIVSKRKDAPHVAGKWVKVKNPKAPAMLRLDDENWTWNSRPTGS